MLAHLRACADQWGGCARAIATQHRPTLRAINPRSWIKRTDHPRQQFRRWLAKHERRHIEQVAEVVGAPAG